MSSPPQMPTAVHYGADDRHAPQPQPAPAPPDQIGRTGTTPRTSSSPPPQNALPNPYSLDGPPPRECLHLHRASESFRLHCVLCVTRCWRARRRVVDVSSVIFALRTDLCYLRTIPEPDVSPVLKYQQLEHSQPHTVRRPARRTASAVLPGTRISRPLRLVPAPSPPAPSAPSLLQLQLQLRIPCIP